MSLKTEIKKTISQHSNKYTAKKVWKIEESENLAGEVTLWIEVSVAKKSKSDKRKAN